MTKEPITKIIANSGYCSRRKAEDLVRKGLVFINEKQAKLGDRANKEDKIKVNNEELNTKCELSYYLLNKPKGFTCTNRKFKGEQNVFDLLKNNKSLNNLKLNIVGRLDKDSQGLILLTNDGDLTNKLTHPSFEHIKIYEVETEKYTIPFLKIQNKFKQGIDIGEKTLAKVKDIEKTNKQKFLLTLNQGQNRQIRKMFAHFNIKVNKIKRISLGPLKLNLLKEGEFRKLKKEELETLKKI
ncbi:rRNA pseudouridine synthase [Patescibacteria group bacterium]|nr:rRNA pseudouridine synthase [Patescibacteria group bacterium]